jgi:hypothetical protein
MTVSPLGEILMSVQLRTQNMVERPVSNGIKRRDKAQRLPLQEEGVPNLPVNTSTISTP